MVGMPRKRPGDKFGTSQRHPGRLGRSMSNSHSRGRISAGQTGQMTGQMGYVQGTDGHKPGGVLPKFFMFIFPKFPYFIPAKFPGHTRFPRFETQGSLTFKGGRPPPLRMEDRPPQTQKLIFVLCFPKYKMGGPNYLWPTRTELSRKVSEILGPKHFCDLCRKLPCHGNPHHLMSSKERVFHASHFFRNPDKGALCKFVANCAPNLHKIAGMSFRTSEEGCAKLSQIYREFESQFRAIFGANTPFPMPLYPNF